MRRGTEQRGIERGGNVQRGIVSSPRVRVCEWESPPTPIPEEPEVRLFFNSAQVSQDCTTELYTDAPPIHCLPRLSNRKCRSLQLIEVCTHTEEEEEEEEEGLDSVVHGCTDGSEVGSTDPY